MEHQKKNLKTPKNENQEQIQPKSETQEQLVPTSENQEQGISIDKDEDQKPAAKKKFQLKYIFLALASVILVCVIIVSVYIWRLLDKPTRTDVPIVTGGEVSEGILDSLPDPDDTESSSTDSSVSSVSGDASSIWSIWGSGRVKLYVNSNFPITKVEQKDPNVENILIIGVDARSAYEKQSRTDSIIVVSIDKKNNSIKLTSFMRDTQAKIPGRTTPTKINSAYEFGGIGLLINTMNLTFGLDIQKFAMVDMLSAENVINAAGGVTITVTKDELELVNAGVAETNYMFQKFSSPSPILSQSGKLLLNGRQAVAYGRIRHIGTDTARTLRQRTILTALITSFKDSSVSQKMDVFNAGFQAFETNMTKSDMLFLSFDVLSGIKNIQQYRVPENGMYTTNLYNYQLIIDYTKQLPALHRFIWGTTANIPVSSISEGSSEYSGSASVSSSSVSGNTSSTVTSSPDSSSATGSASASP